MGALRAVTELPNHPPPLEHLPQNFTISQKTILNLLITKCTNSLENLQQAHALILKTGHIQNHYVAGSLLKCYANPHFGSLSTLLRVLEQVPEPNVFVWNSTIKGCLDLKDPFKAISMYYRMVFSGSRPNKFTYPQLFKACTVERALDEGLQIHSHVVKHGLNADGHIISAGIQMYASLGRLVEARNMLESIEESDVICCNAMIDGYMKFGDMKAATELFEVMEEKSVSSWNTMISGLCSNEMIVEATHYFNKMPEKDEVSWSAMIDGCNKAGCFKEAMEFFNQMQREWRRPSKFVLSSALASSANLGALDQGKWIHSYIKRNRIVLDAVLATSLVDMYAKCGRLDLAWDVFEKTKEREVFCWNAMIGGLAMHGRAEDAIELFLKMNVKPNDITFVALLNACAHAGFVHQGLKYFVTMKQTYLVEPGVEHYGCVVNLLGKAGYFNEAENLINSMPMKPNSAVWGALLGACRMHGNVELAEKVGEILLDLEGENSGRYTLLSNIYAKAGKWDRAEEVRALMKERGVKTVAGRSMIDLKGVVHEFKAGDSSHPQMKDIHLKLEEMMQEIEAKGHQPDTSQVLFDISEEERETSLRYHSEKLAIAFGILNMEPGATIRVVKNLRVCEDCHSATKIISRVYAREIIVRDRVRYHHFRNGQCSCKDFW
ncbi:hypothetical protein C2S51_002632 [Perilla frutescens var. frutescens]|nr:hypothetical protein C2S51_002632 [Perilla frutescens var. frutescens]